MARSQPLTMTMVAVSSLEKAFTLHTQGGVELPVLRGLDLAVSAGECLVLAGPSGAGKSTLLRSIYGNYRPQRGQVLVRHRGTLVDVVGAEPRVVLDVRRHTMGYVSQFLRVVPRRPALDVVAEPARAAGIEPGAARDRALALLERLRIPQRLWSVSPTTFSGGEQQRINIARVFACDYPVLLLDEPTASLDSLNRRTVIALVEEARARGAAIAAIAHDRETAEAIATRTFTMPSHEAAA